MWTTKMKMLITIYDRLLDFWKQLIYYCSSFGKDLMKNNKRKVKIIKKTIPKKKKDSPFNVKTNSIGNIPAGYDEHGEISNY